jgi:hypothetical protein
VELSRLPLRRRRLSVTVLVLILDRWAANLRGEGTTARLLDEQGDTSNDYLPFGVCLGIGHLASQVD